MNSTHPDDELLVAIAAGAAEANDGDAVLHVRSCPTCTAAVEAFSLRLPQQFPVREGVPVEIVEGVMRRLCADAPVTASSLPRKFPWRTVPRSWGIAAALAAGVALWLGVEIRSPGDRQALDRDIAVTHVVHVKRPSLPLHVLPDATSGIAATLHRGDRAEVLDKQGEWWQVSVADDTAGWVLRSELLSE